MSILKPWGKIRVKDSKNKFKVDVWGREYTFDNSIFPTSVISQNEELLYEPIELAAEFDGDTKEIYNCKHSIIKQDDEKVVVCSSALLGNIIINASTTIEYDGYINLALRLVPCGIYDMIKTRREKKDLTPKLSRAELSIKMNKDTSKLFHYWPNTNSSVLVKNVINSGCFFEGDMPFKPCIWTGNERVGINVCMETDQNIKIRDKSKCIKTLIKEEYNEIRIRLLDDIPDKWKGRQEDWLSPAEPISYEIMFEATPVKKPMENALEEWRAYQVYDFQLDIDELHKNGVKWVIFHEDWSLIQNYCMAADEQKLREAIDKCHSLGMKVMLYFGYEYSSAMTDWEKNNLTYLNRDTKGNPVGGWTRENTYQKAFVACYKGGYSGEMIESAVRAMDKYGADGIYTDGTYVPWECANESHGCGYRDVNGGLHITYPIKAVREHVKKLYSEIHKRGGIIDTHQSACCLMPTLAFCDTYFDGENIQTGLSKDFDRFLTLDAFRCEYMGTNFGIVPNFIAYLNPPDYTIIKVLSISLIHNVIARPRDLDTLKVVSKIWDAYDRFGIKDASEKPYWMGNSSAECVNDNVYITSFEKEEKMLIMVSKFGDSDKREEIKLPEKFTKAYEIFDGKSYDIADGKLICQIDAVKSYMFEIN